MSDLQIGTTQKLKVLRKIDTGYVLSNDRDEVLMHISESEADLVADDEVEVFLYQDKKKQTVATTSIPSVSFDAFDWAEVIDVVKNLGAFVNIGINKEILVSKDDLPLLESVWPQAGDMLYVALDTDQKERLVAKPVTEADFGDDWEPSPKEVLNKPISGRIFRTSKEGAVIITEEGYRGFIHNSERKQEPRLGEWVKGRVIDVKDDGTINVTLRPLKQDGMSEDADLIIQYLEKNGASMPFSDKSNPDDILSTFDISKSAFKRALGKLMKEKKIEQKDGSTYLVSSDLQRK